MQVYPGGHCCTIQQYCTASIKICTALFVRVQQTFKHHNRKAIFIGKIMNMNMNMNMIMNININMNINYKKVRYSIMQQEFNLSNSILDRFLLSNLL